MVSRRKIITGTIALTIFLSSNFGYGQAQKIKNFELIDFITNNTWREIVEYPEKDEDFQILVRLANEQEIHKLDEMIKNPKTNINHKMLAIRALGTIQNWQSSNIIRNVLTNATNSDLAYISAWSLIQMGGESNFQYISDNFQAINKKVNDKEKLFKIMLELLSRYKSKRVLPNLSYFLDTDEGQFYKPVVLFGAFGRTETSTEELLKQMLSQNKRVKRNAIRIVGEYYEDVRAIKALEKLLLSGNNADTTRTTINALKSIGTNEAMDALEKFIKSTRSPSDKLYAQNALETIKSLKAKLARDIEPEIDYKAFKKELYKLIRSKGDYGSYEILEDNADYRSIPKLEALREIVMLNRPYKAIQHYTRITDIMRRIRLKNDKKVFRRTS